MPRTPAWLRGYGRRGVRILAVPAWDFARDGRLHSRMAVVRGVENGFSMARVAQNGLLTFSDGYGRILSEASSDALPEAMLIQDVRPGPGRTFYTDFCDWFGCGSVAGLVGLMVASRRARSLTGKRLPLKRARMADPAMTPSGPPS